MSPFAESYLERLAALHADAEKALDGLPPEALDWSPGPEVNSLAVLAVHLCGAQRYLLGDVIARDSSARDRDAEFQTRDLSPGALKQRLAETLAYSRRVVESLSLDALETTRPFRDGREVTVMWVLAHALGHTAIHVGHMQVTRQWWNQR
jgi:hypothetical protein